ncbi:MAG: DHH family phosphoesterase [Solirubrobacteraceae bacterium]|nr:DHH family phosphoesterase [Solirubrobacteraceae bacterium]
MDVRYVIAPAAPADVERLRSALGIGDVLAEVLVRRGMADPSAARSFLAADVEHRPSEFAGLAEAVDVILDHVHRGTRIVVHGDYDCDGVCATAILVRTLRRLGADVDWFLPDRIADGYGLAERTVRRLADDGVGLVITCDCGITAVDESRLARELGVEVVVTDHHRPRADGRLPDVPIVHPAVGPGVADGDGARRAAHGLDDAPPAYPCPELCGAGVAWRVAGALLEAAGHDRAEADVDLDLVALATVADVVPLVDENRRLVREGLAVLADTRRPGMRALLEVAATAPADVDATALGFRLAPRVNAAGRLGRADVGVALFLAADGDEARRLAQRLDRANRDRQEVAARIAREAEAQADAAGDPAAHVLVGDWHPGVVGIVASRIVERTGRPTVLLSTDGVVARGSARSVPGYDLLAGLDACAEHLTGHGGHHAAAGLTLPHGAVPALRDALCAHAARTLEGVDPRPPIAVDAVVGGAQLGLATADELARLGPCGQGNPEPVLLIPAARAEGVRSLGRDGAHLAFTLRSGDARVAAVAWRTTELPTGDGPLAGTFTLERHVFRGSVTPRLQVRTLAAADGGDVHRLDGDPADVALVTLDADLPPLDPDAPSAVDAWGRFVDRSIVGGAAAIASAVASGVPVTVVTCDAEAREAAVASLVGGCSLTDWWSVVRAPRTLDGTGLLVALDPPTDPAHAAALGALGDVRCVRAWGGAELRFTLDAQRHEHDLRPNAEALFRRLRHDGATPVAALLADVPSGRRLGMLLRVLEEAGVVAVDRDERIVRPVDGPVRRLEDGDFHRDWAAREEARRRWLSPVAPSRATTASPSPTSAAGRASASTTPS